MQYNLTRTLAQSTACQRQQDTETGPQTSLPDNGYMPSLPVSWLERQLAFHPRVLQTQS